MKLHLSVPLISLALAVLFSGCATPSLNSNQFLTPEAKGRRWGGDAYGGITQVTSLDVAGTAANGDPYYVNPSVTNGNSLLFGADLGLLDSIDVFTTLSNGPQMFGAKFQFFGQPQTSAKSGNFSMAAAGAAGAGSQSSTGEGSSKTTSTNYSGWQILALFGYRPTDLIVLYANPFWLHLKTDLQVKNNSNGNFVQPDGEGDTRGVTVGGRFELARRRLTLTGEISIASVEWTRNNPSSASDQSLQTLPGFVVGFAW